MPPLPALSNFPIYNKYVQDIPATVEHVGQGTGIAGASSYAAANVIPADPSEIQSGDLGQQTFVPTPLNQATFFASTTGSVGNNGSINSPYSLQAAINYSRPGNVIFIRGGTYSVQDANVHFWAEATDGNSIIFEAYPGEEVIIDGSAITPGVGNQNRVNVQGKFQKIRGIKITNMPEYGAYITGLGNILENCEISYCKLSGVFVHTTESVPYSGNNASRNGIIHCNIHHCSDNGLTGGSYANGANASGIVFSSGKDNYARNNSVHHNSNNGIDTLNSHASTVNKNIVFSNGVGSGSGNGIKAGGANGKDASVYNNMSLLNILSGFTADSGVNVSFRYNTSWDNDGSGFVLIADTIAERNVSSANGSVKTGVGIPTHNSWDLVGTLTFVSTNPLSIDYLKVVQDGIFDSIGAHYYADVSTEPAPIFATYFQLALDAPSNFWPSPATRAQFNITATDSVTGFGRPSAAPLFCDVLNAGGTNGPGYGVWVMEDQVYDGNFPTNDLAGVNYRCPVSIVDRTIRGQATKALRINPLAPVTYPKYFRRQFWYMIRRQLNQVDLPELTVRFEIKWDSFAGVFNDASVNTPLGAVVAHRMVLVDYKTMRPDGAGGDFRYSVGLRFSGGVVRFVASGDSNANNPTYGGANLQKYWEYQNASVAVPVGEFFGGEVYFKRAQNFADLTTGRFRFRIKTAAAQVYTTVFDVNADTMASLSSSSILGANPVNRHMGPDPIKNPMHRLMHGVYGSYNGVPFAAEFANVRIYDRLLA